MTPESPTGADGRPRWLVPASIAWAVFLVAVPARYYLPGHDSYDERFAWRMFSAVRVQRCATEVVETRFGQASEVNLGHVLPAPWISLLQRNRPAVVESFLDHLCASERHPESVRLTSRCTDARGESLPEVVRERACSTEAP